MQDVADDRVDPFVGAVFDQEAEPHRGPRVPFLLALADLSLPDRIRLTTAEAPPLEPIEREGAALAQDDFTRAPGDGTGVRVLYRERLRLDVGGTSPGAATKVAPA